LLGQSKLAHEEDIQRGVKCLRHLKPYRHPASRQGEHDNIIAIGVLAKFLGEQATRFCSISKRVHGFTQGFISGSISQPSKQQRRKNPDNIAATLYCDTALGGFTC
jgi:hypothetical protein